MANKMNKRPRTSVNPRIAELEKELQEDGYAKQNTFSVDAGRDVQTDVTSGQRRSLGSTISFLTRLGLRRRHPQSVLNQYAALYKTNKNPKTKYEQFINEEHKRIEMPETVKKARNVYATTQMGLVQLAAENFAKSKAKLTSISSVGV